MSDSTAETKDKIAYDLSNNMVRLLREFSKNWEQRVFDAMLSRGFPDLRKSHMVVFSNLGLGAVRVTELAERAQVTQQAMGKMLKEIERLGYISRDIDSSDKRAKKIRFTERGVHMQEVGLQVTEEIRAYYASKIGQPVLDELEAKLRDAVSKLDLNYLPESWPAHNKR